MCASCASTGLCGGPRVTAVPTATRSDDGGITFSQEAAHVSPLVVTPAAGKGLRTLGGFLVSVGGRLDKSGAVATGWPGDEAGGKPGTTGAYTNQR